MERGYSLGNLRRWETFWDRFACRQKSVSTHECRNCRRAVSREETDAKEAQETRHAKQQQVISVISGACHCRTSTYPLEPHTSLVHVCLAMSLIRDPCLEVQKPSNVAAPQNGSRELHSKSCTCSLILNGNLHHLPTAYLASLGHPNAST